MFDPFNLFDDDNETVLDMFNTYDDSENSYEIIYPDKTEKKLTAQQLYEFFIFNDTNIGGDFDDLKKKLDSGLSVTGDHMEWDWTSWSPTYKGKLIISRRLPPKLPPQFKKDASKNECRHENKYVNHIGSTRFWVCPKCKKDLGDA